MKACLALLALVAMATSASAAKLVVMAVNSGLSNPPVAGSAAPTTAGAKGFLIGIDNTADVLAPLSFQDMTFTNVLQVRGPTGSHTPVQNFDTAVIRDGTNDATNTPPGPYLAANDSFWWVDSDGTAANGGIGLVPVSTGITGGANPPAAGTMTMTGAYNTSGNVPGGIHPMAYVVVSADTPLAGILASGQFGFDLVTGAKLANNSIPSTAVLDYATGTIRSAVPEPSSIALAAMALVGLGVGAWKRRK